MRNDRRARCSIAFSIASALMISCGGGTDPAGPRPRDGAVAPTEDTGTGPAEDAGSVEPGCEVGLTDCDGTCTDTRSDFASCGACGNACAAEEVCAAGACQRGGCPGGTTSCGGSCVDTSVDGRHCGGCGMACGASETCTAGECVGCGSAISFAADVQPILTRTCLGPACHGGARPAGDLVLESGRAYAAIVGIASSCSDGRLLVAPGAPDDSYLVHKITGDRICTGNRMPLGGAALSAAEIATISDWVCGGARDD